MRARGGTKGAPLAPRGAGAARPGQPSGTPPCLRAGEKDSGLI